MFSNSYIFRFASIMVVLVAALLSAAALLLKPYQENNIRIEKMKDILAAANIPADARTAIDLYNQNLYQEIAVTTSGEVEAVYSDGKQQSGSIRPFDISIKELLKTIEDVKAGKSTKEPLLPLFIIKHDSGGSLYVFPVRGRGLWGPVWGNIALKDDLITVAGAKFDHQGETPGLGAEISTDDFKNQFINKKIFDENGNFTSIRVLKPGIASGEHQVDAISGGTITSNGVSLMLETGLENYLPYIKKIKGL